MENLDEALHAQRHDASRLELCANLDLQGTTPDTALILQVISAVHIPVKVMIRPRGGDFVYAEREFDEMVAAIKECKSLGVPEIVTGVLRIDNTLDIERIAFLAEAAYPMPVTIHKCIDLVPDILEAIEELKQIPRVNSILSSGQAETAALGVGMLKRMLLACGERLTLIVAGKVTQENLPGLVSATGAWEFHGKRIVPGTDN